VVPVDTVSKGLMLALEVKSVEIGVVASAVPPRPFESAGAIVLPRIIVVVLSAELCPLLWQRLPKFTIYACVDDPKFEELGPNDEIVDGNLGSVAIPVFHLYEQLLRLAQCDIIPVGQPNPVILVWVSKTVPVICPAPEEIICWSAKVPPSLQHSPPSSVSVHVTEDIDGFASESDWIGPTLGFPEGKLVRT